jgi:hypothetical protein
MMDYGKKSVVRRPVPEPVEGPVLRRRKRIPRGDAWTRREEKNGPRIARIVRRIVPSTGSGTGFIRSGAGFIPAVRTFYGYILFLIAIIEPHNENILQFPDHILEYLEKILQFPRHILKFLRQGLQFLFNILKFLPQKL